MKKASTLLIWGIAPLLIAIGLAIVLIVNLIAYNAEMFPIWLGFAYWALTALIVLLAIGMMYHFYLKLSKMLNKQQLEREKQETEKHLDNNHHKYRLEVLKNDVRKQELDLEIKMLKKKKT